LGFDSIECVLRELLDKNVGKVTLLHIFNNDYRKFVAMFEF